MAAEQQHAAVLLRLGETCLLPEVVAQQEALEGAEPELAAGAAGRSSVEPEPAVAAQEALELVRSGALRWPERASSQQQAAQELDGAGWRQERRAAWR